MYLTTSSNKRYFYDDGFRKRAACVCVRNENEDEVLLITSSRKNDVWIVPGGGIEENENAEEAALREAMEEAGVEGELTRFLGVFENVAKKKRTKVYVLVVKNELEEWEEKRNMVELGNGSKLKKQKLY